MEPYLYLGQTPQLNILNTAANIIFLVVFDSREVTVSETYN